MPSQVADRNSLQFARAPPLAERGSPRQPLVFLE
jgi:hypothetical protein